MFTYKLKHYNNSSISSSESTVITIEADRFVTNHNEVFFQVNDDSKEGVRTVYYLQTNFPFSVRRLEESHG